MLAKFVVGTLFASLLASVFAGDLEDFALHHCGNYIERDVAIIGGGTSGTHAAVKLRRVYNQSVVLIEIKDFLGGHVGTYFDEDSNRLVNYGVMNYNNFGNAKQYVQSMGVEIQGRIPYMGKRADAVYVNPYTGKEMVDYTPPTRNERFAAMNRFVNATIVHDNILLPGFWNFPIGDDIPGDLLLPWHEFVKKHQLEPMFWFIKTIAGPIGHDDEITLFALLNFNSGVVNTIIKRTSFVPQPFDMRILYNKIREFLGEDALLSTTVTAIKRTSKGVALVAEGRDGHKTCICAKKLLIAAQPWLRNIGHLDLDEEENHLFSQFVTVPNYVFLFKANFIPVDKMVQFMSPTDKDLSFTLSIEHTLAPNVFRSTFNTYMNISIDEARDQFKVYLDNLKDNGVFNITETPTYEIVAESDFTSVQYNVSAELVKAGFMQRMYGLFGKRSTWYTGGLWSSDYTANVWAFTDTVLPKMMKCAEPEDPWWSLGSKF